LFAFVRFSMRRSIRIKKTLKKQVIHQGQYWLLNNTPQLILPQIPSWSYRNAHTPASAIKSCTIKKYPDNQNCRNQNQGSRITSVISGYLLFAPS
jgi:hypothetical protein